MEEINKLSDKHLKCIKQFEKNRKCNLELNIDKQLTNIKLDNLPILQYKESEWTMITNDTENKTLLSLDIDSKYKHQIPRDFELKALNNINNNNDICDEIYNTKYDMNELKTEDKKLDKLQNENYNKYSKLLNRYTYFNNTKIKKSLIEKNRLKLKEEFIEFKINQIDLNITKKSLIKEKYENEIKKKMINQISLDNVSINSFIKYDNQIWVIIKEQDDIITIKNINNQMIVINKNRVFAFDFIRNKIQHLEKYDISSNYFNLDKYLKTFNIEAKNYINNYSRISFKSEYYDLQKTDLYSKNDNVYCFIGKYNFKECKNYNEKQLTDILNNVSKLFKNEKQFIKNIFDLIENDHSDIDIYTFMYNNMKISKKNTNSIKKDNNKKAKEELIHFKNLYKSDKESSNLNTFLNNGTILDFSEDNANFVNILSKESTDVKKILFKSKENLHLLDTIDKLSTIIYYENSDQMLDEFDKIEIESCNIISVLNRLHYLNTNELNSIIEKFNRVCKKNGYIFLTEYGITNEYDIKIINIYQMIYELYEKKSSNFNITNFLNSNITLPCNFKEIGFWNNLMIKHDFIPLNDSKKIKNFDKTFIQIYKKIPKITNIVPSYIKKTISVILSDVVNSVSNFGKQILGQSSKYELTFEDLNSSLHKWKEIDCETELIKLHDYLPGDIEVTDDMMAYILIIRNGINNMLPNKKQEHPYSNLLFKEQDTLTLNTSIVNKDNKCESKYNMIFGTQDQISQLNNNNNYIHKWNKIPLLEKFNNKLKHFLNKKIENLKVETNYYHDIEKCGLKYHGNTNNRNIQINLQLGASMNLDFN